MIEYNFYLIKRYNPIELRNSVEALQKKYSKKELEILRRNRNLDFKSYKNAFFDVKVGAVFVREIGAIEYNNI